MNPRDSKSDRPKKHKAVASLIEPKQAVVSPAKQIRVLLVDDHLMVRMGLSAGISAESDLKVVGEARNATQALEQFQKSKPDVTVLDLRMPGQGGVETLQAIRRESPEAQVLMFSAFEGQEEVFRAMEAGASGYLLKSDSLHELVHAIRQVHRGERVVSPAVSAKLASRRQQKSLSPREHEVLSLICAGMSNKEICTTLKLSMSAVKLYTGGILTKLGVADRTQAALYAVREGLVDAK